MYSPGWAPELATTLHLQAHVAQLLAAGVALAVLTGIGAAALRSLHLDAIPPEPSTVHVPWHHCESARRRPAPRAGQRGTAVVYVPLPYARFFRRRERPAGQQPSPPQDGIRLDALAAAHSGEIIIETASTRGERPKLYAALDLLQPGDTLAIYKPDRVARSMKELLVLLEDRLHARGINLHILTGICAGIHRRNEATIADKMLFMVAVMAAQMERDLIRERTLDGLRVAEAQGRRGGRPPAVDEDVLAIARSRQARGESLTTIARHLGIGRSTLYRAMRSELTQGPDQAN